MPRAGGGLQRQWSHDVNMTGERRYSNSDSVGDIMSPGHRRMQTQNLQHSMPQQMRQPGYQPQQHMQHLQQQQQKHHPQQQQGQYGRHPGPGGVGERQRSSSIYPEDDPTFYEVTTFH